MKIKIPNRIIVTMILLSSLLLIILFAIQPTSATPTAEANEWTPHKLVSAPGGRKPVIRSSPASNSNRILLVYDQWNNGTGTGTSSKDPFYSISNDNGTTWSTGQLIADAGGSTSDQTIGLLDYQDTAFAFWIETISGNSLLVYSKKPVNGAWSSAQNITTGVLLADPNVTVDNNNTIHLVWSDTNNIYYSYLPQNGTNWQSPIQIATTNPPSLVPAIAVADNGDLYIVWQEDTLNGTEIRYSAGVINGNQFVPHANSNYIKLSADEYEQATLPLINISGNLMQIAYADKESPEQQNVNFGSCTLPCTGLGKNSFQSITSPVGVNDADPTDLVANLAYSRQKNISFIYYHGIKAPGFDEAILGINSGNGWRERDEVTDPEDYRGIEPSITFNEKTSTLHLAYDQVDSSGGSFTHQIYVTQKFIPSLVYLPTILKN